MSLVAAFLPQSQTTVNIAANNASQLVQLVSSSQVIQAVRAFNSGNVTVFVAFGSNTVTANASTSMPIGTSLPAEVFSLPNGATYAAAITSSGNATVFFTSGEGI
jgi:hypothetical protein